MRYVDHEVVKRLLDSGHSVRSLALGRIGKVQKVTDDGWFFIKHPHRSGGVTRFDSGDEVELQAEGDDTYTIRHPQDVLDRVFDKEPQQ